MKHNFPLLQPKIILGIAAHPDDLDVGAGGTIAEFIRRGAIVHYLILTNGSKGSDDPDMTSEKLITIRRSEQQKALEIVAGTSVTFLDYPDGELEITMGLKKDIVKVIRTIKPDVVITMDPTVIYSSKAGIINHPDHRAAGQATLDAIFPLARDRLTFPELAVEGFEPHKVAHALLINFDTSNYSVDITDTFELKLAAIKAHASQFGDLEDSAWLRDMALRQGQRAGYSLAESFVRIDIA